MVHYICRLHLRDIEMINKKKAFDIYCSLCVTCGGMLCCSGPHASLTSGAHRLPSPMCSGHPGAKLCHAFRRGWCEPTSMWLFPAHLQHWCPPPPGMAPPLTAAYGGDSWQVMVHTRYPHILPRGWASSSSQMWLIEPLPGGKELAPVFMHCFGYLKLQTSKNMKLVQQGLGRPTLAF